MSPDMFLITDLLGIVLKKDINNNLDILYQMLDKTLCNLQNENLHGL